MCMSSIRLFVLSSFEELGPMHGHRLRTEAERKHVPMWTDITVGAVYGAMTRLAAEGLLREAGQEQDGNRPVRQLFAITKEGRMALAELRRRGLREIWFKHDPFDLALTRFGAEMAGEVPAILKERLSELEAMFAEAARIAEWARPHVGLAKHWALRHSEHRLAVEIEYMRKLIEDADAIVSEEVTPDASGQV